MNDKKTKLEEMKDLYSYDPSNVKWLPKGGEILKYIGNTVVFVEFTKDQQGQWHSKYQQADILEINDYDPMTMTYKIKYHLQDMQDKTAWKEERIIPEGFSYDIVGMDLQNSMNRFVPRSLHCKMVETEMFYNRLQFLYAKRDTLSFESLKMISDSKDQSTTLSYCCNLGAVFITEDTKTLLYFRIHSLKCRGDKNGEYVLSFSDEERRNYQVRFKKEDKELKMSGVGTLKIIDAQG